MPITEKTWRTHPAIKAVRALIEANEAAIKSGDWRSENAVLCRSEYRAFAIERTVIRDTAGRIRKYVMGEGSDDSAYTLEHQYDAQGRLRFAYGTAGAVNGSTVSFRIYFSESGDIVWRDRQEEGPGYSFAPDFPDADLVRDPAKALTVKATCPEP